MTCVLLLLLMADPRLQSSISLDNRFQYLNVVDGSRIQIARDGTFLAMTPYTLWHWRENGQLIRRLGQKGQGPGEFIFLLQAQWDGTHYWLMDGLNQMSTFYDAEGTFLFRKPFFFRQFIPLGKRTFVADYSGVRSYSDLLPPVLQEITYTIGSGDVSIQKVGPKFRKVTPQQRSYDFNFKKMWLAQDGDALLIVDQLQPVIQVYGKQTMAEEAEVAVEKPFEPPQRFIKAPLWIPIPETFPERGSLNQNEFRMWWQTWSRVTHFSSFQDDLIFAFETESPEDALRSKQVIQRISKEGHPIGEPLLSYGHLLGVRNGLVYLFEEEENANGFIYRVDVYKL